MEYAAYLREQADRYRDLADEADSEALRRELLDLATTCEQVAANIEDRTAAG